MKYRTTLLSAILLLFSGVFAQSGESANLNYGIRLYEDKMYDVAVSQFRSFLEQYPSSVSAPLAMYRLAESYLNLGDNENALRTYKRVILEHPRSEYCEPSIIKTAELYENAGEIEIAARYHLQLKNYFPRSSRVPESYYRAVKLFRSVKMNDQAKENGSILIKEYPANNYSYLTMIILARIYEEEGQNALAEMTLRDAFRSSSGEVKSHAGSYYAEFMVRQNDHSAARRILEEAIVATDSSDPKYYELMIDLSGILIFINDLNNAARRLETIKNAPEIHLFRIYDMKGDIEYFRGHYEKALNYFDIALKHGRNIKTEIKRALSLSALNEHEKAGYSFYSAAVELPSEKDLNKSALINSARSFFAAGNYERGVISLRKYMELFPGDERSPEIDFMIGKSYFDSEKYSSAYNLLKDHPINYPGSEFCDNSLFFAAESALKLEEWKNAHSLYSAIVKSYGASEFRPIALRRIKYLDQHRIRSKDIIDKLADISSRSIFDDGKKGIVYDWARFFFFDMKDYAKADRFINKYKAVSDDAMGAEGKFIAAVSLLRLNIADAEESEKSYGELKKLVQDESVSRRWRFSAAYEIMDSHPSDTESDLNTLEELIQTVLKERLDDPDGTLVFKYFMRTGMNSPSIQTAAKINDSFAELKHSPHYDAAQFIRALILKNTGDADSANSVFKYLSDRSADSFVVFNSMNELVNSPAVDPSEKIRYLSDIQNRFYYAKSIMSVLERKASVYQEKGDEQKALDIYLKLEEDINKGSISQAWNYDSAGYSLKIGDIYFGKESFDEAEFYYRTALSNRHFDINRREVLLKLSEIYRSRNDRAALEENLKLISELSEGSDSYSASVALADLELENNNITKAIQMYRDILKRFDPEDKRPVESKIINAYYMRKSVSEADKLLDEFRRKYRNDYDRDIYDPQFSLARANSYLSMNEFDRALRDYRAVIRNFPQSPQVPRAMYGEAIVNYRIGKGDEAFKIWTDIVNRFPDEDIAVETNYHLGAVYNNREEFDKAITAFQNILRHRKDHRLKKNSLRNLIDLYQKLGFNDAAARSIREYISAYPEEEDVFGKRIELGIIYQKNEEYGTALDYFRRLQYEARGEDEVAVQFYIADTFMLMKNFRQAITEFLKVRYMGRIDSPYEWRITAVYKAALCYEELNEFDRAIELLEEIVKQRPNDTYGRQAQRVIERIKSKKSIER